MRVVLGLEYFGAAYTGWQSQRDGRGIQDALERALAAIADSDVRTIVAGRTDARVHATMQVVHFDTGAARPVTAWVRGVNANLRSDIGVLWAQPVGDGFHARRAATARHYVYALLNRPVRPALLAGRAGWYHHPLDIARMIESARVLVGTHDFSAFRAAQCQARSPTRTLTTLRIAVTGDFIYFDFCANAFLHHMIRNIVGALVYVGANKRPPSWIGELLAGRDRTRAAPTFAPEGLYLTGADYNPQWGLPMTRRPLLPLMG